MEASMEASSTEVSTEIPIDTPAEAMEARKFAWKLPSTPPPKKIVHQTGRRPERSRQHTKFNARIGTHSKPSRTPGNVSHTVLYDAIFLPHGTACADFNCAGEARATYRKPLTCGKTFTK